MAKKNARENERRALAEQMRRDQARKERTRSIAVLGVCVVIVIALLHGGPKAALRQAPSDAQSRVEATPLAQIGATTAAASCSPVTTKAANGNDVHLPIGTKIDYPDAPPAFGKHWGNFLQGSEIRNFYTTQDRPPLERLVHSLEHGHTILWYDDTVRPGTPAYTEIQQIADKLPASAYFMSAPWTSADGAAFPSGKHVAFTHWTGPDNQRGATQYCGAPSGQALTSSCSLPRYDAPEARRRSVVPVRPGRRGRPSRSRSHHAP